MRQGAYYLQFYKAGKEVGPKYCFGGKLAKYDLTAILIQQSNGTCIVEFYKPDISKYVSKAIVATAEKTPPTTDKKDETGR